MTTASILIASKNSHKIDEMRKILGGTGIRILSAVNYPDMPDVQETGQTLEENAVLKAVAFYEFTGMASVADDTGLEVDVLSGEPGIFSARYAGEGAGYTDNLKKLLAELDKQDAATNETINRKARFRTVIALKSDRGLNIFHGMCEGTILHKPAGTGGFGYDPVFRPDGYSESFAQMDASLKNRISHRAIALRQLKDFLLANRG